MQPHDATDAAETAEESRPVDTVATALTRAIRGAPDDRVAIPALARVLLASIFLVSATTKLIAWSDNVGYAASAGLPLPEVALAFSVAVELLGGLALVLGRRTWLASLVLAGYLVPTTLLFHQFWAADPAAMARQLLHFTKNLAIVGGLAAIVLAGRDGLAAGADAGGVDR